MNKRMQVALAATLGALALPGSASAITVGQALENTGDDPCPEFTIAQTAVDSGTSYDVPAGTWTITGWQTRATGGSMQLKVLRGPFFRNGDPRFFEDQTVFAESALEPLTTGLQTYPVTITRVKGGDHIALFATQGTLCAPIVGTESDRFAFVRQNPSAGSTFRFTNVSGARRISIAATLIPDADADVVADDADNCPDVANADQADTDGDRVGDACDSEAIVTGAGSTKPPAGKPANQFAISAFEQSGTLKYTGGTATFDGTIQCVEIFRKRATIVAIDSATGRANRTQVQDNGASGDKLVNTLFTPSALSPKAAAKALECSVPDFDKLDAAAALPGNPITVNGATP